MCISEFNSALVAAAEVSDERSTDRHPVVAPATVAGMALVVVMGERRGTRVDVATQPILVGRAAECAVRLREAGTSREHCRVWRDGDHAWVEDLGSTNGTFLNNRPVVKAAITVGDYLSIGNHVLKLVRRDAHDGAAVPIRNEELSTLDALTRLPNRRAFRDRLDRATAARTATPPSVVLINVDFFRRICAAHGQAGGDQVLRGIAAILLRALVGEALAARLDRDEFVVLLPQTDLPQACAWAGRLREQLREAIALAGGKGPRVTASFGVAQWSAALATPSNLLRMADDRLILAKLRGRDRVCGDDELCGNFRASDATPV